MEQNYRTRLFRSYLVNIPYTLKILFEFLKTFDQNVQKKIHVNNKNVIEAMFSHIDKNQIEEKFGGTKPNMSGQYFPPECN